MEYKILVRGIGEFEDYIFLNNISEFEEFYLANEENFSIYEIATIGELETTALSDDYTVYDITLKGTGEHFWLMENNQTGMYTPVDSVEDAEKRAGISEDQDKEKK
ncbi:MAG: hypothetical protein ACOYB8_00410 [Eubacteriaceae bacterium]|jgi:hypothetical protein